MRHPALFATLMAVAAGPPPKEADVETIRRIWGTVVDPKKDCTVRLSGNRLVVKVPGSPHEYDTTAEVYHAARILQDVTGDCDRDGIPVEPPAKGKTQGRRDADGQGRVAID